MKGVSLYLRDTDEKVVDFLPGAYVIGRSNRLKCYDKKISHNHAVLHVTPDKVTLKSTHVNPCFFKSAEGSNLTILKQNEPFEVKDGDTFGLLPHEFWYKVKFCDIDMKTYTKVEADERLSDTDDSHSDSKCGTTSKNKSVEDRNENDRPQKESRKREIEEITFENGKKIKISDSTEKETQTSCNSKIVMMGETNVNYVISNSNEGQSSGVKPVIKVEEENLPEQETSIESCKNDENVQTPNGVTVSSDNAVTEDDNQPSSSTINENVPSTEKKKIRDRCWYGSTCYRKNPNHKKELSHPGDSDYESDENDDRLACPFGINCYRRNKIHRQQFKHPKTQVKLKDKKRRKKTTRTNDNDTPEDDYDYDDPFLNDDSSDDYVADDDDSDSDWDQEDDDVEEEDTKRLVKEAKRFTKGTK